MLEKYYSYDRIYVKNIEDKKHEKENNNNYDSISNFNSSSNCNSFWN